MYPVTKFILAWYEFYSHRSNCLFCSICSPGDHILLSAIFLFITQVKRQQLFLCGRPIGQLSILDYQSSLPGKITDFCDTTSFLVFSWHCKQSCIDLCLSIHFSYFLECLRQHLFHLNLLNYEPFCTPAKNKMIHLNENICVKPIAISSEYAHIKKIALRLHECLLIFAHSLYMYLFTLKLTFHLWQSQKKSNLIFHI